MADNLSVDQDQRQATGALIVDGLHDRCVADEGVVLLGRVVSLHLNALGAQPLQRGAELHELLVHLRPAHARGAAHRRIEHFDVSSLRMRSPTLKTLPTDRILRRPAERRRRRGSPHPPSAP